MGWFMMAEGRSGKSAAFARLQSPVVRDAAATCEIHIYYHMYSADSPEVNGTLSVHLADSTQTYTLWESKQSSAKLWRRVVVFTGRIPGEFQVFITASRGALSQGDFAVDDLEFRHCSLQGLQTDCGVERFSCMRGSCVEPDSRCDGTDDCGDNSDEAGCDMFQACSFESDLCTWNSSWGRVNGYNTTPERDHTTNRPSGFFLRAPQNGAQRVESPVLQTDDTLLCYLVFYYYMDGSSAGSLSVGYHSAGKEQVALKLQGQRGASWVRERVSFNQSASFQIFIEGSANGTVGSVAVDDLILSPGCKVQNESGGWGISSHRRDGVITSETQACQDAAVTYDFRSSDGGWSDVSIGTSKWGRPTTGSFLAVLKAEGNLKTHAETHSPLLCPLEPSCVNMTYYLHTGPAGFLALLVWDPQLDAHSNVWQSHGDRSNTWKSVLIPLGERPQAFQLVLAGAVDPGPVGNWSAAVSEIRILSCWNKSAAAEPATCNFEAGLCGWYQDATDDIDWKLGNSSDHTTGHGYYMFVSGESRLDRGMKARLVSYKQTATSDTSCLSFHHRMFGPDTGTLNLLSRYDGVEELIWTSTGTRGDRWHREYVPLTNKTYQLVFEAVCDGSVGHIAIDDITVTSRSCAAPTRCSFEAGTCGFSSQGTYRWSVHQNLNQQTGPSHDHTLQSFTGHCMVVDTGSGNLPRGGSALLTSAVYSGPLDEGCLSFWYQMGGSDPGTLIALIEEDAGNRRELLRISDATPGSWRYGSAALQTEKQWKLLFEAIGAGGEHSFIAVDDVHISHHRCPQSASCDFEGGSCSWTNVRLPLLDMYDWDWTNGASINRPHSAPAKDRSHDSTEGHYAFVDTGALHAEGTSAWLVSDHLSATTGSCFTFSYRTDSADHFHLGELVLYVSGAQGLRPVWGLHGYYSGVWQEEKLQLNSSTEYQLIFQAMKGRRLRSVVLSLDDLQYTPDTLCIIEEKQKGETSSGPTWAIVLGVIAVLLCLLLLFFLYRRWRRSEPRSAPFQEDAEQIDGFDNVSYDS
ncbi:apical endosomal glycoprotein isoform X2 [Eleutherodactylus coqui]|uniref:apical endosomal glycoprotein isoform X2 n=1 Tax=Eleutherodactylus coqui TaxID=57060 RepID=UPI003462D3F8